MIFLSSLPFPSLLLHSVHIETLLNINIFREIHHASHFIKKLLPTASHPQEVADSSIPRSKEKDLGLITLHLSAEDFSLHRFIISRHSRKANIWHF